MLSVFLYSQSTPVGTTIFRNIQALDKDAGVNGLVEYFVVEGGHNNATTVGDKLTSADGYGTFAIAFPHQGQVREHSEHTETKRNAFSPSSSSHCVRLSF